MIAWVNVQFCISHPAPLLNDRFLSNLSDQIIDYSVAELFLSMKMIIPFSTVWFSKSLYLDIHTKNDSYKKKK